MIQLLFVFYLTARLMETFIKLILGDTLMMKEYTLKIVQTVNAYVSDLYREQRR